MRTAVTISDHVIWFKHVAEPELRERLSSLEDGESIFLDVDGTVGQWKRMVTGRDGRKTAAIRPEGEMKSVWNQWFRSKRGTRIEIREAVFADDYLAAGSELFSEWNSPEDEEAFRDL